MIWRWNHIEKDNICFSHFFPIWENIPSTPKIKILERTLYYTIMIQKTSFIDRFHKNQQIWQVVYFKSAFARRYCRAERRSTLPHPQPHVTTPRNHPTVGCNPFHHPYPLVTCWMIRCGLTDLPAHAPGHDVNANAAVLTVSRSYYCTIRFYKVEIRSSVLVANEIRSTGCPDSIKGDSIREISLCATISDLILRWVICFRYIVILVYGNVIYDSSCLWK